MRLLDFDTQPLSIIPKHRGTKFDCSLRSHPSTTMSTPDDDSVHGTGCTEDQYQNSTNLNSSNPYPTITCSRSHGPEYCRNSQDFFVLKKKKGCFELGDDSEVSHRRVREASVRNERLGDRSQPIDEVELRRAQGDASGEMYKGVMSRGKRSASGREAQESGTELSEAERASEGVVTGSEEALRCDATYTLFCDSLLHYIAYRDRICAVFCGASSDVPPRRLAIVELNSLFLLVVASFTRGWHLASNYSMQKKWSGAR